MINYNKNKLINECLSKYYETFARTLDTADFVPAPYNDRILAYIFKNMRKAFKKIDKVDRRFQRQVKAKQSQKKKQENARVKSTKKRLSAERKLAKKQATKARRLAKKQNKKSKRGGI